MVVVDKKRGETKDGMFRKFSKLVMDEQISDDIKKRKYYLKPSLRAKEDLKIRLKKRAQRRRMMRNAHSHGRSDR